jgi:hypothetical protein
MYSLIAEHQQQQKCIVMYSLIAEQRNQKKIHISKHTFLHIYELVYHKYYIIYFFFKNCLKLSSPQTWFYAWLHCSNSCPFGPHFRTLNSYS